MEGVREGDIRRLDVKVILQLEDAS
jgi:hypothetical protein